MSQKAQGNSFNLNPQARGNVVMPSIALPSNINFILTYSNEREQVTYPSVEEFDV